MKTFNVEEQQPPPPKLRPASKPRPDRPRLVAPPPVVRLDAPRPTIAPIALQAPPQEVTPVAAPTPAPEQSPPPPPAIEPAAPRSATGDLQNLFRPADYPLKAIERHEQGSVTVRLTVNVTGRVGACDVTSSSGSRALDATSCQVLQTRALFTPARDSSGNLTSDTVSQEVRWMLH